MTRRFYTDPLEAAWMSACFGMEFVTLASGEKYKFTAGDLLAGLDAMARGERFTYHVHQDSLPLLEPIPGDLIHNGCCSNYYIVCDEYDPNWNASNEVDHAHAREWFSGKHHGRIIQRDGKPFFWPESEPA